MLDQPSRTLQYPVGGVARSFAVQSQPPFTSIDSLNCWGATWPNGRRRGGTRPPIASTGIGVGTPYNWCEVSWYQGSTLHRGIAVTHSTGTTVIEWTGSFTSSNKITTAPASDFASPACYMSRLYQASSALSNPSIANLSAGTTQSLSHWHGPTNCGLLCAHGDRLYFAGDKNNPSVLYAPRIGGHIDSPGSLDSPTAEDLEPWDYASIDTGGAWKNSGPEPGKIGQPITALISHSKNCLIIGMTDSMATLVGNPRASGDLSVLDPAQGPLMQSAWCYGPSGVLFMLVRGGLGVMSEACGSPVTLISESKLPADLRNVDPGAGDTVAVGYDAVFQGVNVFIKYGSGSSAHWRYDIVNQAYEPMSFSAGPMRLAPDLKPFRSATKSAMLLINSSGTAYQYDANGGESFSAYVVLGPIMLGGPTGEGVLHAIQAIVGSGSGDLGWAVFTGNSPEEAYATVVSDDEFTSGEWDIAGLSYFDHPRAGGAYAYIKLFSSGTTRWSLESIAYWLESKGVRRVH